ncbi:MAG: glycosyltransferase family 2 protein [Bacteroidota bacterium]
MDLSIVIPIFNEEKNLPILYDRLSAVCQKLRVSYELIFVNDGSSDGSLEKIRLLSNTDQAVDFIDFSRNFGHQLAVTAGLDHAEGDAVVIIDGDLQDPPEFIEDLYRKWQEGYEVVYAKRKKRKGEKRLKRYTAAIFYRILSSITSINIPIDTGDFRIIDRKVVEALKQMPEHNKFIRGQIAWIGFNQVALEYERDERHSGTTGYTIKKMFSFAMDGITAFSNFPLRLVTFAGFVVSLVAFILILYALYSKFILKDFVQGWTSIMLSILFLGGIQLISIGIIGEYISRINNNARNRPLYIIRESKKNKK